MEATELTPEQQQVINELAAYGKKLEQLAVANVGKWVAAGYAYSDNTPSGFYCYCGIGRGYKGAPIVPANGNAVVFASKEAAERKANQLKYTNGRRERIILKAMPANEYFWQLHDELCRTICEAEQLAMESNKRK